MDRLSARQGPDNESAVHRLLAHDARHKRSHASPGINRSRFHWTAGVDAVLAWLIDRYRRQHATDNTPRRPRSNGYRPLVRPLESRLHPGDTYGAMAFSIAGIGYGLSHFADNSRMVKKLERRRRWLGIVI